MQIKEWVTTIQQLKLNEAVKYEAAILTLLEWAPMAEFEGLPELGALLRAQIKIALGE